MKYLKITLILFLFAPPSLFAFSSLPQIKVESTWGNADKRDIQAVLNSVGAAVSPYIGNRHLQNITVRNDTRGPISLYQRGINNEYIILLDVRGRYWAQLAYQFSHELCHLLTNYELAPNNITRQQWFEESLCEAFSLFTLKTMSKQWRINPPYENWRSYSNELFAYAQALRNQRHRSFASNLPRWYRSHRPILERDPYAMNRVLNEKMASHLLEVFEKDPNNWAAINYLNLGPHNGDQSLHKYLQDWYSNTPEELRSPIKSLQKLLGQHFKSTH